MTSQHDYTIIACVTLHVLFDCTHNNQQTSQSCWRVLQYGYNQPVDIASCDLSSTPIHLVADTATCLCDSASDCNCGGRRFRLRCRRAAKWSFILSIVLGQSSGRPMRSCLALRAHMWFSLCVCVCVCVVKHGGMKLRGRRVTVWLQSACRHR